MHDLYDRLENRTTASREGALFRDLNHILSVSKSRVPALRAQLKGLDLGKVSTRADLAKIPIRRCSDLLTSQADAPPFGGFAATRLAALSQVFVSPSGLFSLSGHAKDWWGMARALYAGGLRKGALILNTFSYDLVPDGHMVEAGARAIGCPLVPAGNASQEQIAPVLGRLAPKFFCGRADHLKRILDHTESIGVQTKSLKNALVTGPMKPGLRHELILRGIAVHHAVMLPELGVIAYESGTTTGLTLTEGLLLEIVDPETGGPVAAGEEGEIVLSRINVDYPLLRYATGLISSVLPHPATCGRTNTRISLPRAKYDAATGSAHFLEIQKRHPELKMRLCTNRPHGPHLKVEHRSDEPHLRERLGETLQMVTRWRGTVEIVRPGTLPEEDALVSDESTGLRH